MLKLLKNSSFSDPLVFLDEIVQNAQRAGATKIEVSTEFKNDGHLITLYNDGPILEDHSILFKMAESGWNQDIVEDENPFGIGFLSTTVVSDFIEIISGKVHTKFDVIKTLNREDDGIISTEIEPVEGFTIKLNRVDSKYSDWRIEERLEALSKFNYDIDVYFDGHKKEKASLINRTESLTNIIIEDENFEGNLFIDNVSWSHPRVYSKGREVMELYDIRHAKGKIHMKNSKALNLRAPDRKDIIRDDAYNAFMRSIKELMKDRMLMILQSDRYEDYTDAINSILDDSDIEGAVRLAYVKSASNKDIINRYMVKDEDKRPTKLVVPEKINVDEKRLEVPQSVEVVLQIKDTTNSDSNKISFGGSSSSVIDKQDMKPSKNRLLISEIPNATFYVGTKEIFKYQEQIRVLQEFDIGVVVADNKLELAICSNHLVHIGTLNKKVTFRNEFDKAYDLKPSVKRALFALNYVLSGLDITVKAGRITKSTKVVSIPDINFEHVIDDCEKPDIVPITKTADGKGRRNKVCILNIDTQTFLIDDTTAVGRKLTLCDFKFLLKSRGKIARIISNLDIGKSRDEVLTHILQVLSV